MGESDTPIEVPKRIKAFDISKGIGIILVIIGHSGVPSPLLHVIYSFHVPLFFVISGYFYKESTIKENIIRSFRRYIVPYLLTCLVVIVVKTIEGAITGNGEEAFLKYVFASLYGASSNNIPGNIFDVEKIGAIWFLQALFWSEVFLTVIVKIRKSITKIIVLIGGY